MHASSGAERERLFELLTVLLFAAHSVTYKTGYEDLSGVVEDRITWAASHSSDLLMGALAAWARTTSMLSAGSYGIGQRLLDRTQQEIDSVVGGTNGRHWGAVGRCIFVRRSWPPVPARPIPPAGT